MRKSKKVGTEAEITQVWVDEDIALDMSGSDVISSYIYGQNLICGAYGWYLYNAHGDVTALTDSSGEISKNYDYDPFGVQHTGVDETDLNPYRYCGEYYDVESGYTYLQTRYYDPELGRFVSEDPALDGINWYVYCGNDPVNMIDPTGMWSGSVHKSFTSNAYETVYNYLKSSQRKIYKIDKNALLNGCVYPDIERKNNKSYKAGKWHGHSKYYDVMLQQLKKAKKQWKKKKYEKAYFELGKGLHTIQDFYAHNVMLNGNRVSSRKVANGKIRAYGPRVILGDFPQYIDDKFIFDCQAAGDVKSESQWSSIHAYTADNPNAYFNGTKWVRTSMENNSRVKKAQKHTEKYLSDFLKFARAKKGTKPEIYAKKLKL